MSLYDEGHTIAGWTGVAVTAVGGSVAGVGVCVSSGALVSVGLVIVALAALVTWVLHLTGWGKPPGVRPREEWGMRVRDPHARDGHPECLGCRLAGRGRAGVRAGALSVAGPTVVSDGTGMEVRGAAVVGAGARADVGRGAS
ncbi:HGxxPAAW family protein [Streptomyces sp. NPDC006334]|uniref:HGxxPAAW family protein n=1 Tax=Streptomyces sp. NPDC006334 TaxID=3156754 RepID=UPI0033BF15BC